MRLWIFAAIVMLIGYWIAMRKPKPGQDPDKQAWVGGFIAGLGVILWLAAFSAWATGTG
jgi:hypothetical protein